MGDKVSTLVLLVCKDEDADETQWTSTLLTSYPADIRHCQAKTETETLNRGGSAVLIIPLFLPISESMAMSARAAGSASPASCYQ